LFIKTFFRKEGNCNANKKSIHINRAFGSDFHHCIIDGIIATGTPKGSQAGQGGCLSDEPETVGISTG
jgi:hypothetical protein